MIAAVPLDIRVAREDDEAEVVALWRAAGLVVPVNDPVFDFRLARTSLSSDILVGVTAARQTVCTAMVGHDGHRGWIYYVACDPGSRGNGFGKRIVQAAETWIRERGIRRMHLMVRETNTQIMPFYERLGFAKMPYQVMSKWLDEA